ncbi:hypothetical protein C8Q79DRAFT_573108 [Trametes meyenii]|nr:hypothetical protein C8Q79DRAFT_573108 [Trametes meyenii]
MALTATVLLATFAVFDSMAVPLTADNTTDVFSTLLSSETSTWASDTTSSSAFTPEAQATAITTTSNAAAVSSGSLLQSSLASSSSDGFSAPPSGSPVSTSVGATTILSTIFEPPATVTITGLPQTVTDTITITPPPAPAPTIQQTVWSAPPQMTDLSAFSIQNFAYGHQNMRIIVGQPPVVSVANSSDVTAEALSEAQIAVASAADAGRIPPPPETNSSSFLQLFYPANSINPAQEPQGGADFYASPLALGNAKNVSMEYSVFFPADFNFVAGGKLPGLYGGHDSCSGGDDALQCFSTRLMWRENGLGELYLYAPKDKQTDALCSTPPQSVCDADWGLSIGRGAFSFKAGNWTHVRQTVTLNTPGEQDGGFALDVDGKRVIERCDVYYRGAPQSGADPETESAIPAVNDTSLPAAQDAFIKGPFHLKVDSVLAKVNVARDFTPAFVPPGSFAPFSAPQDDSESDFTPAFAPPTASVPAAMKVADSAQSPAPDDTTTETFTSTTTVVPTTQTVTLAPTTTKTAYVMALESDAPFTVASATTLSPIGFTGLFFSTFFGGHEPKYATPKDQFTWFKDFSMTINA